MIFALFAFGYLFGLVGLLIAVPLAASIGVLVRFALRQPDRVLSQRQHRATAERGVPPPTTTLTPR